MHVEENVRLSAERYRAAASFLVSVALYVGAFSAVWNAFGFGKALALLSLFLVVRGHRAVSAFASRWVKSLPRPTGVAKVRRGTARRNARPQKMLVIDHDPEEFKRSYR